MVLDRYCKFLKTKRFLFYKQHFYKQHQAEIDKKIKQKLSSTLRLNIHYLKAIHFLHPRYHPKVIADILKNIQKASASVLMSLWLMTMKTRLKIKNRSQIYDINGPRPRHGYKYTKHKMYLSIIMVACIKQHLNNIWSSIHDEKVKQHRGWAEKKRCL